MTTTTTAAVSPAASRGGGFLIEDLEPREIFTAEDYSDEQVMLAQTGREFMEKDVLPRTAEILKLNYEAIRELMRKAGEIGLLGIEVPEDYGGLALGKVTGCLASEISAMEGSWAVTFMGHTGIGTLPITYFGTDEQKARYLPRFGTGEWISSYSLSEASSASDALNAKARAVLSNDGKNWILNGEKMWLTNGGFADVYITFAKVDGEHFSAFIIDKGSPGVSLGPEERKLGIKGSSTRPLILQDAVIPKENLLGEIGKGHKIAFNILNIGRFKLGAGTVGGFESLVQGRLRLRPRAKRFRQEDRRLWSDPVEARRDGGADLRRRSHGLSDRGDDRCEPRGGSRQRDLAQADRGVRRRVLDGEGLLFRGSGFRGR